MVFNNCFPAQKYKERVGFTIMNQFILFLESRTLESAQNWQELSAKLSNSFGKSPSNNNICILECDPKPVAGRDEAVINFPSNKWAIILNPLLHRPVCRYLALQDFYIFVSFT